MGAVMLLALSRGGSPGKYIESASYLETGHGALFMHYSGICTSIYAVLGCSGILDETSSALEAVFLHMTVVKPYISSNIRRGSYDAPRSGAL